MTTRFSLMRAYSGASNFKGTIGKMGILQRAQLRWQDWREEREQERMRRAVEERRIVGRKPVAPQIAGKSQPEKEQPKGIKLQNLSDIFKNRKSAAEKVDEEGSRHKAAIMVLNKEKAAPEKKGDPKIAKGNANYKLPSINLLREG